MASSALEPVLDTASVSEASALETRRHMQSRNTVEFPAPSQRIPALDGLRGVAILLVLLRHSIAGTPTTSPLWSAILAPLRLTWSGVDLFFVLSGFLIGGILLDARSSPNYFRTFYLRRAFRILPVYYLFLAAYFMRELPIRLLPGSLGVSSSLTIPWYSFVTFTHNFWMARAGWFGSFAVAPTWSLAIEEQFYLCAPFVVWKLRRRTLLALLIAVIAGVPFFRAALPHLLRNGGFANYVLMPCRADALSMGVLAALLVRNQRFRTWITSRALVLHATIAFASGGILFLTYKAWDQYSPPMTTWGFSCLALFYACALTSVVCGLSPRLHRLLCFTPLRNLGMIAYCTYMLHALLIQAARTLLRVHTSLSPAGIWAAGGMIGVAAALVVASLSWRLFEKPLLRRGHRYQY